jgi:alkaline phosphatase
LTQHAIKHLENPNGYFLLIEASQVDWAGHANDIGSAMAEMHDLALT